MPEDAGRLQTNGSSEAHPDSRGSAGLIERLASDRWAARGGRGGRAVRARGAGRAGPHRRAHLALGAGAVGCGEGARRYRQPVLGGGACPCARGRGRRRALAGGPGAYSHRPGRVATVVPPPARRVRFTVASRRGTSRSARDRNAGSNPGGARTRGPLPGAYGSDHRERGAQKARIGAAALKRRAREEHALGPIFPGAPGPRRGNGVTQVIDARCFGSPTARVRRSR